MYARLSQQKNYKKKRIESTEKNPNVTHSHQHRPYAAHRQPPKFMNLKPTRKTKTLHDALSSPRSLVPLLPCFCRFPSCNRPRISFCIEPSVNERVVYRPYRRAHSVYIATEGSEERKKFFFLIFLCFTSKREAENPKISRFFEVLSENPLARGLGRACSVESPPWKGAQSPKRSEKWKKWKSRRHSGCANLKIQWNSKVGAQLSEILSENRKLSELIPRGTM